MVRSLAAAALLVAVHVVMGCSSDDERHVAAQKRGALVSAPPASTLGTRFWFFPNQLAANDYYRPDSDGRVVNGHWEESFARPEYWPRLSSRIAAVGGGVGIIATELAWMRQATLDDLRVRGLRISTDEIVWTQCNDGHKLARQELFGEPADGQTLAKLVYSLSAPPRPGIYDAGFFKTVEGADFRPHEIVLDERIPGLLPDTDIMALAGPGDWETRKRNSHAGKDHCRSHETFNAGVPRMLGLMNDYVEYARVLRERWPSDTPQLSFHWNLHPGWEWRDESCWDEQRSAALARGESDPYSDPATLMYLRRPCHNGAKFLLELVRGMCADGTCPHAVYFDLEIGYDTAWTLEELRRHKQNLSAVSLPDGRVVSIGFGINLHDLCTGEQCVRRIVGDRLVETVDPNVASGLLYQESVLNVSTYLTQNGILDADTHVKFFSWSRRPREIGAEVHEDRAGSMAHATHAFLNQFSPAGLPTGTLVYNQWLFAATDGSGLALWFDGPTARSAPGCAFDGGGLVPPGQSRDYAAVVGGLQRPGIITCHADELGPPATRASVQYHNRYCFVPDSNASPLWFGQGSVASQAGCAFEGGSITPNETRSYGAVIGGELVPGIIRCISQANAQPVNIGGCGTAAL